MRDRTTQLVRKESTAHTCGPHVVKCNDFQSREIDVPLVRPVLVHYNSTPPLNLNSFKTMGGLLSTSVPFEGLSEKDTVIV